MPDYKGYEEPDTMEQTLSQSEQNMSCGNTWQFCVEPDDSGSDSGDWEYSG